MIRSSMAAASAAAFMLVAGPASAQAEPETAMAAARELTAALQAAQASGAQPPKMSDPASAALIRKASEVAAADAMTGENLGKVIELCATNGQPMMGYVFFGTAGVDEVEANRRVAANSVGYQDELAPIMRFSIRCMARMFVEAERFTVALPEAERTLPGRREGVARSSLGGAQSLIGAVMVAIDPSMRVANREMLLDEAVLQAGTYARGMKPVDRAQVVAVINGAPHQADPSVRSRLARIREAMSLTTCEGLCAL